MVIGRSEKAGLARTVIAHEQIPGPYRNGDVVERDQVLYVIVCAAPPASEVQALVKLTSGAEWDVHVIATPEGLRGVDSETVEDLSRNPVRSEYRLPGEGNRCRKRMGLSSRLQLSTL
jgi:hypothetical protein